MKKQILIGAILIIVIAVSAWNVSLGLKHDNIPEIAFVNLDAIAQDENTQEGGESSDIKEKFKKNYINASESCEIKEVFECNIGLSVPSWVPKIGGIKCEFTYQDEVIFPGTKNDCTYTGNPDNACDYYQCRKNI